MPNDSSRLLVKLSFVSFHHVCITLLLSVEHYAIKELAAIVMLLRLWLASNC